MATAGSCSSRYRDRHLQDRGEFHAYSNIACTRRTGLRGHDIAAVEERNHAGQDVQGLYFSDTGTHFVCPGTATNKRTSRPANAFSDRKLKLRRYKVVQKGEEVYGRP